MKANWFHGQVLCPSCGHRCFDHCACVDAHGVVVDPPCLCADDAHFSGRVAA